jgi:hypothetical protein
MKRLGLGSPREIFRLGLESFAAKNGGIESISAQIIEEDWQ